MIRSRKCFGTVGNKLISGFIDYFDVNAVEIPGSKYIKKRSFQGAIDMERNKQMK